MHEAARAGLMFVGMALVAACLSAACGGSPTEPTGSTPTAVFSVTSLSAAFSKTTGGTLATVSVAGTADTCPLVNAANPVLDCSFDGSASTPSGLTTFVWTYSFGTQTKTETTTGPKFQPTLAGCTAFGGQTPSTVGGVSSIVMKVDLQVRDSGGTSSSVKSIQNVRVFPAGACGYAF